MRPSSIWIVNIFTNTEQEVCRFKKKIWGFSNFNKNRCLMKANFWKFDHPTQNLRIFKYFFMHFKNFLKSTVTWCNFLKVCIHIPSLGPSEVSQKIWARSVQLFWRLLDTNEQTNRKAVYIVYPSKLCLETRTS